VNVELRFVTRRSEITITDSIWVQEVGEKVEMRQRVLQYRQRVMGPSRSHKPSWTEWQDVPEVVE
jgi:hypothetical protein